MKTIALLALTLMLRPSDIAPKAIQFDPESSVISKVVFSQDSINFKDDGSVDITFFGIKNDTDRSGSVVTLPPAQDPALDPVQTLRSYINATQPACGSTDDNAVFLTVNPPYQALDASHVAQIMEEAIQVAGLAGQGFTAKSFRPTGATMAIANNQDPKIVMKVGRWKTESVFYGHYVHTKTPEDYTGALLQD